MRQKLATSAEKPVHRSTLGGKCGTSLLRLQNVCAIPGRNVCPSHFRCQHLHARRCYIAPRRCDRCRGHQWKALVGITNLDPNESTEVAVNLRGISAKSAVGETLTAPKVDSVNTFETPNTVVPKPVAAKVQGNMLSLKLDPKSVTVISFEQ